MKLKVRRTPRLIVPSELAVWLCWAIPAVATLFVPLVAKLRQKLVGWYAVAITFVAVLCTVSLIPTVLGAHAEPIVYSITWMPAEGINLSV
ncbi:MAG: hypothetical protein WC325_06215, partial [Candidatus Bathyarchaeia archaeon]